MAALVVLLLILAIFGGLGFAVHVLWIVLAIAIIVWLAGFIVGPRMGGPVAPGARRRRWYW